MSGDERDAGRVCELRVHGVSGSPPEAVLGAQAVVRVAGDGKAGFYRERGPGGRPVENVDGRVVEAYCWGGLTSGGRGRALWLLLTPFTLVNVGAFTATAPYGTGDDGRVESVRWRVVRRGLEIAQRLLALSLTGMLVLAAVVAAMDLVGWQYVRQRGGNPPGWLRFLAWDWLRDQPRPFLVAALVPLAVVGLLWFLARQTWATTERTVMPGAAARETRAPLEDRRMWNGRGQVRRLRAVHVTAGLALVAAALVGPLWFSVDRRLGSVGTVWGRAGGPAVVVVSGVVMVLLVTAVVLACRPSLADRPRPEVGEGASGAGDRGVDGYAVLPWLGLAVVAAAAGVVGQGTAFRAAWPTGTVGPMPGLGTVVHGVLLAQAGLLVVVAGLAAALRWIARRREFPQTTDAGAPAAAVTSAPVWAGLAPAGFGLLAVGMAAAWAAGLAFAVARLLGRPEVAFGAGTAGVSGRPAADALVVPDVFSWAAVLAFAALAGLVPLVGGLAVVWVMRLRTAAARVWAGYRSHMGADRAVTSDGVSMLADGASETSPANESTPDGAEVPHSVGNAADEVSESVVAPGDSVVIPAQSARAEVADSTSAAGAGEESGQPSARSEVGAGVGGSVDQERVRTIARIWAVAGLDGAVACGLGVWMAVLAAATVAAAVGQAVSASWAFDHLRFAVTAGTLVLGVGTSAYVALGRRAFKQPGVRRVVGILWDLGTFWPRAAHPLAPPCYMERTVPDLLLRLGAGPVAEADQVLLSCHSQGTVIGAAVVMQLEAEHSGRLALLTYGSPLRRLYAAIFPAYFSRLALGRTGQFLRADGWTPGMPFDDAPAERHTWRWRNLYRTTDPIGGPIFADHTEHPAPCVDVDWWLLDPAFARPPGDSAWPVVHSHLDYPADPLYDAAAADLTCRQVSASPVGTAERTPGAEPT